MELQPNRKKVTVNATISPYLVKKMDKLIEDEEFSSSSDLISIAVTEFLVRYPCEMKCVCEDGSDE